MTARQAIRTPYPFHAANPRARITCCLPRKLPRRSVWQRLRDEIARICR